MICTAVYLVKGGYLEDAEPNNGNSEATPEKDNASSGNRFRITEYGERGYALFDRHNGHRKQFEKRLAARPAHLERLETLNRGSAYPAGPNPAVDSEDPGPAGFTGSLIVAEFASE